MSELAPGVLGPEIAPEITAEMASVIASGAASESAGGTSAPGPWTLDPAWSEPPVCISYEDSKGSQVAFYWY